MGRRALRKIDPALDLSRHLVSLDAVPSRFCAGDLFGREGSLEIEVGSGKGLFLLDASAACPQHNFLGIEISQKYAKFAAAKLAKAERTNAVVIHGDAAAVFDECLRDRSAIAVHVYFPDPWWKERHKKRRIMNESFLRNVQRVLEPTGVLHFWTDVSEYFQTSLDLIVTSTSLEGPLPVPQAEAEHDMDFRTHFERRMRKHDMPVYRAEFRKTGR